VKPISGGGKSRPDSKKVALEEIIARLNDLFGDEDFTAGQKEAFAESPDLEDAIVFAVEDNQGSHNRPADFFYENTAARDGLIALIANLIHLQAGEDRGRGQREAPQKVVRGQVLSGWRAALTWRSSSASVSGVTGARLMIVVTSGAKPIVQYFQPSRRR